jgi:hypothetical protein
MNAREGAEIVRAISDSLRANPAQFQMNITVTGQRVTSHGGTGVRITAVGGGPGSTTIGQKVSLDGASIEISQARASEAMTQQLEALVDILDKIARELESPSPDKPMLERTYRSLVGTWVPGVITSVIGNVLTKAVGL